MDQCSPKISSSPHPCCSGVWDRLCESIRQTLFSSTIRSAPSHPDFSYSRCCWLTPSSAHGDSLGLWLSPGHREGLLGQQPLFQRCPRAHVEPGAAIAAALAPQRSWMIVCSLSKSEAPLQPLNGSSSILKKKKNHYFGAQLVCSLCLQSNETREETFPEIQRVTDPLQRGEQHTTPWAVTRGDQGRKEFLPHSPLLLCGHQTRGEWAGAGAGLETSQAESILPPPPGRFRPCSAEQHVRAELPRGSRLPRSPALGWMPPRHHQPTTTKQPGGFTLEPRPSDRSGARCSPLGEALGTMPGGALLAHALGTAPSRAGGSRRWASGCCRDVSLHVAASFWASGALCH